MGGGPRPKHTWPVTGFCCHHNKSWRTIIKVPWESTQPSGLPSGNTQKWVIKVRPEERLGGLVLFGEPYDGKLSRTVQRAGWLIAFHWPLLFLIGLFSGIASYLITLGLSFIGLSYVIVYFGAVSILFLFILMLIDIRIRREKYNILLALGVFSFKVYSNGFRKKL